MSSEGPAGSPHDSRITGSYDPDSPARPWSRV